MSFAISLSEDEYTGLHKQVTNRCEEGNLDIENPAGNIFIVIPSKDLHLMLTGSGTVQLYSMMEGAGCEMKSLQMISMFNA